MDIARHADIPSSSLILRNWSGATHYVDSYQFHIVRPCVPSIDELACIVLASDSPRWEKALSRLRDLAVGCFGLKTGMAAGAPGRPRDGTRCEIGDRIGFFPVIDRSESEIVMALDDKHLGFRVSLLMGEGTHPDRYSMFLTTVVQFHNAWGRLYFVPVKPFHRLIVRQSLKRFLKRHRELVPESP